MAREKFIELTTGDVDLTSLLHFDGTHPAIMQDHPCMKQTYEHIPDASILQNWKEGMFYKDGMRHELVPQFMCGPNKRLMPWYNELQYV